MPSYEMSLILKILDRPHTIQAIKRTLDVIKEKGGILRSLENLGERQLPYRMSRHGEIHRKGTYLMVNFDCSSSLLHGLRDHMDRDLDVVRPRILRREVETGRPCEEKPCQFGELSEDLQRLVRWQEKKYIQKL